LDASREAVVAADAGGHIVFANAAAQRLWGYAQQPISGRRMKSLFPAQFEFPRFSGALSGAEATAHAEGVRADGSSFPVRLIIKELEIDGATHTVVHAQSTAGEPEAEQARTQAQTFEALEQFAAGLALELNNVLTGVLGNIHLAMEESGRRGRLQPALLEAAHHASLRARELTKELLEFARGDRPEPVPTALPQLVRENCLLALSGGRVMPDFEFARDLSAVLLDPAQIGQVIHQLVTFAAQSIGHSGKLHFRAVNVGIHSREDTLGGQVYPGDYVRLDMRLDGAVFTREEVAHLFEPYSRRGNPSAGLSLAICRGIVKRHGGLLHSTLSRSGDQLTLHLLFPASTGRPEQTITQLDSTLPVVGGAHILIMDDQQMVRVFLQRALEGMGHRVTTALHGEEAIQKYQTALERGDRFDLAFLDISIPGGMGARQACRELLNLDPTARCVVISGNTSDEMMVDHQAFGFAGRLDKPFDVNEMQHLVEDLTHDKPDYFERMVEEEEDEDPVALSFFDNIVEYDFRSADRFDRD